MARHLVTELRCNVCTELDLARDQSRAACCFSYASGRHPVGSAHAAHSLCMYRVHQVVLFIDSIVVFPTLSDNPSQLFLMRCSANGPDVISAKAKKLKHACYAGVTDR